MKNTRISRLLATAVALSMVISPMAVSAEEVELAAENNVEIEQAAGDAVAVDEQNETTDVDVANEDELTGSTAFGSADKSSAVSLEFNTDYIVPLEIDSSLSYIPQWFKFTTDETGYFEIKAYGECDLELYNANGNKLYTGDIFTAPYSRYTDRLEAGVTYYIHMLAHSHSAYGVKAGIFNTNLKIAKYPDSEGSSISEAKIVGLGDYQSTIAVSGDIDYLKFVPNKTGYYCIYFSTFSVNSNDPGVLTGKKIHLCDSNGTEIHELKTYKWYGDTYFKLDGGTTYYITALLNKGYTASYTLSISETNTVNPTMETATGAFEIGKEYSITSEECDNVTEYWYQMKTEDHDAWYQYKLEYGANKWQYNYQFVDASGNLLANGSKCTSYYSTREQNKDMYLHLASGGTSISAKWSCTEYSDPEGDTADTGYQLTDGVAYLGNLCLEEDCDWYKITPETSGTYTISMKSNDVSKYLYYDLKDGETSVKSGSISKDDKNSTSISANLLSGKTYYLKMESEGTGGYTLTYKIESKPVTTVFSDLGTNAWYINAVQYAYDNNIMNGTSSTTFSPSTSCTRTMMVTILWNAEGKKTSSVSNPFSDVKTGNWFYNAVLWAYDNGITKGTSSTTFGNSNVTREQMAQFLMNYAKLKGYDTSARADVSKYDDAGQISGWALTAIRWANANGIINGKSSTRLDPKGGATRAEVAQMVMNFQNKFGK